MIKILRKILGLKPKIEKSYIQKLRDGWNKNINIIISDKFEKADLFLFDGEVLHYPPETKIGRILIDVGLAKSWAEVKGSQWNKYEIPWGFTDLYLNGLSVWNGERFGKKPHRLTILRWEDPKENNN